MTLYLVSYWLTVWLLPCKAVNSRHRVETHAGPRSFFLSLFSIKRIVCKLDKQYLLNLSTCTSDCPWNNIWTAGEMIFSSLFVSEPCEHQTWSFRLKDNFVQGWRNHWHHNLTIKYKEYTKGSLGFLLRKHPGWRYQKWYIIYELWFIFEEFYGCSVITTTPFKSLTIASYTSYLPVKKIKHPPFHVDSNLMPRFRCCTVVGKLILVIYLEKLFQFLFFFFSKNSQGGRCHSWHWSWWWDHSWECDEICQDGVGYLLALPLIVHWDTVVVERIKDRA